MTDLKLNHPHMPVSNNKMLVAISVAMPCCSFIKDPDCN